MLKLDRRDFLVGGAVAVAVGPTLFSGCARQAITTPPKAAAVTGAFGGYFAANFGIDQETCKRTISRALSKGGDFADVYFQHKVRDYVAFEDGQVNRAYAEVDLGAGVRVLSGDQTGFAYTEDLSIESLLAAAETAASIASAPQNTGPEKFTSVEVPDLYERKQVWLAVGPEKKISMVQYVGDKVLAGDPSVIKASVYTVNEDEVFLVVNSIGEMAEDIRPMTKIYATCVAEKDGRKESNTYRLSSREGLEFYSGDRLDTIADEAVKRTMLLFDAVAPPAGEMPVVLAPATSGILLHEAIGHGMEADFNRKGTSIFSTMIGKKVAEDFVTIVDTALESKSRGSINVDDEAIPGQRTLLVENGKLVSYLHDRLSAKHYKVAPTGNGRRESFRHAPLPRMRVTTMESGPHDPEEIIRSVKKGIYAVDFTNGEVTIGAGDYSFYVKTGYLIEDGKLTQPIKDSNLIGNGPDTLTKMTMVGNDQAIDAGSWTCGKSGQSVPVSLGMPTVKVSSITVGGVNS
jgi:TldD protein